MPYQKPKSDHPWRKYKDSVEKNSKEIHIQNIVYIKTFLVSIVENWDTYEITSSDEFEGSYRHKLRTLPQDKIAAWLADVLKRNYAYSKKYVYEEKDDF